MKRRTLAFLAAGLLALVLGACSGAAAFECTDAIGCVDVPAGEPVHVAYMLATSGAVEFLGADSLGGIEIAIQERGEIHGHELKLSGEDSLCSAEGGQTAAQKVAADPTVVGVIGTNCSSAGTAASEVLSDAGFLMMSPTNTSPALTDPAQTYKPGYFRTAHNDLFQGAVAAQYAFEVLGHTTAAAIHDGDPYTEGLATSFNDAFEKLGGTMTAFEGINKGDTDMRSVLTSIAADAPEVLYFPIFEPEGNFVAAQTLEVPGLEGTQLMGADGLLVKSYGPNTGSAAEGMFLSGPYVDPGIEAYAAFLATYEANTGGPPPAGFAAHAYDATNILLDAIESVAVVDDDGTLHIGRQALRDAITATDGFAGLTGVLSCGDKELIPGTTFKGDCATGEALAIYELTADQVASEDNWPAPIVWTP
jgi:branched-chain amino acid transport system substrate-binding protein